MIIQHMTDSQLETETNKVKSRINLARLQKNKVLIKQLEDEYTKIMWEYNSRQMFKSFQYMRDEVYSRRHTLF